MNSDPNCLCKRIFDDCEACRRKPLVVSKADTMSRPDGNKEYTFVTKEDFFAIDLRDYDSLVKLEQMIERVLRERDAYREVAMGFYSDAWSDLSGCPETSDNQNAEAVDAEARTILSKQQQENGGKNG